MNKKFDSVQVLLWDFDGTLYRLNSAIWNDIFEAQYQVIIKYTGWTHQQAKEEHKKMYKVVTQSSTDVVARLCHLSIVDALFETEERYDRTKYVSRDEKLVQLFSKLHGYRHIMFVNGKRSKEEPVLTKLGIDASVFETWMTPEVTGVVKPDTKHFASVLTYTNLPPECHMVIGDREEVDLAPAKKLGMKTCLVYSNVPGKIADISLPDIYSIENILV